MADVELATKVNIVVSATAEYIAGLTVKSGKTLHLTSVHVEDEDNTWNYADLILRRGGLDIVIARYYPASAVKRYTFQGDWWVPETCQVVVMLSGATADDIAWATVNGVYVA